MEGGEEVKMGREDEGYVEKFLCDCGEEFTKVSAFRRHKKKCKVKTVERSNSSFAIHITSVALWRNTAPELWRT